MIRAATLALCAATALSVAAPAAAKATFLAQGTLGGAADKSGLTYSLENGLRADILGGIGSGLAYAGGNTFLAIPDRGPNATPYNSAVDDTVSYVSRFHTLTLDLAPSAAGSPLPFTLSPTLTGTTLLYSPTALVYGSGAGLGTRIDGSPLGSGAPIINDASHFYFSGRSDNYGTGTSGNAAFGRLDPEAIRLSNDGRSVFVSDEYGPYVRQFDRATGKLVRTYELPANLDIANLSPRVNDEIANNTSGRTTNKGMEGLAITPDGKTLVGFMQAALLQDAPTASKLVRIVTIDIATGETHQYGYQLTNGSGVSEVVAINDHEFLVDERDGKGLGDGTDAKVKQIFKIDLTDAQDITTLTGADAAKKAVAKSASPFLDLVSALVAAGVPKWQIPSKIEGLAFGQDVTVDGVLTHTLWIANDNDFLPGTAGGNNFYVFGFTDGDLPGFLAQQFAAVPEPATWAMMVLGFGLVGGAMRRRHKANVRFV